ncbi:MAG: Fur family transcriptional regulator [Acidimicrobiales bacterium]
MSGSAVDLPRLHEAVATKLRPAQQRYTTGRRQLVELLASMNRPVTMPEVLQARPTLNQSSVYRNLAVLEQAGVVQRVLGADDRGRFDRGRFELAEDLIGHHHHLICNTCGRIDDFVVPAVAEADLDAALHQVISTTGFVAAGHRLDVVGTCASCS